MNNSKTNTVLLVIIIILLAVGLYVLMGNKQTNQTAPGNTYQWPNEQTNVSPTQPVTNQQPTTPVVQTPTAPAEHNPSVVVTPSKTPGWSRVMEESGMSVLVPKGYSYNTLVPNPLVGHGTELNVTYNSKNVLILTKFSNQSFFNDSVPGSGSKDYTLMNAEYLISGVNGKYYKGGTGLSDLIIVPSKLVIVSIEPLSSGVSQATLDEIISSISL